MFRRQCLEDVLLDIYHPDTGRRTRYIHTEDGAIIVNDQDRRAILEANARARADFDPYAGRLGSTVWTRVASIPKADWLNAQRQGITYSHRQICAWLNRSDTRQFRTDDCRRL